jgi:hypothetical protein
MINLRPLNLQWAPSESGLVGRGTLTGDLVLRTFVLVLPARWCVSLWAQHQVLISSRVQSPDSSHHHALASWDATGDDDLQVIRNSCNKSHTFFVACGQFFGKSNPGNPLYTGSGRQSTNTWIF